MDWTLRIAQHVVPLTTYTPEILSTIIAEIKLSFSRLTSLPENRNTTIIVSLAPEPFFNAFSHSRGGAYPHPASRQVTPMSSFVAYSADPTIPLGQYAVHPSAKRAPTLVLCSFMQMSRLLVRLPLSRRSNASPTPSKPRASSWVSAAGTTFYTRIMPLRIRRSHSCTDRMFRGSVRLRRDTIQGGS